MKILKVWDSDYPWDVRVEKIVTSFIENGHEVHLVCRNKKMKRKYELVDGLHIHRLPTISNSSKINEILSFPAFFSPFWIDLTNKVVKDVKPDLILVRDLPLCLMGWFVGKINKIPVILDMAEDYPEQCKNVWKASRFKFRNIYLRNPILAEIVERISIKLVDQIIVVIEESKERLVKLGVPLKKISIVRNTPVLEKFSFSDLNEKPQTLLDLNTKIKLVYLGLLDNNRGLSTPIKAMARFKKIIPNVSLIIVGKGTDEQELKNMVRKLGLQKSVFFEGWVDYQQAQNYLKHCDIGIIPHRAIPGWHTTIPNKLFDYMLMAKPVIVSNVRATARIVLENKCGVVYKDHDISDFTRALLELIDPRLRTTFGRNGYNAVMNFYNWKVDSKNLSSALTNLDLRMASVS